MIKFLRDGRTYNTATATALAEAEWEPSRYDARGPNAEAEGTLYQTRGGAFFLITVTRWDEQNADDEWTKRETTSCSPMSAEAAQRWLNENEVRIFHNPFGDAPEAEAEEESKATVYFRVPPALKQQIETNAREAGMSMNEWMVRTVEKELHGSGR